MSRRTITPVVVIVLLAFAAFGVASASAALPEFTGTFPNQVRASLPEVHFENGEGTRLSCTKGTATGSITGPKALALKLALQGCGFEASKKCESTGAKGENEIISEELKSSLVYISKATKEVGILINSSSTAKFATFTCSKGKISEKIRGWFVAPISTINAKTNYFSMSFKEEHGKQVPHQYETEGGTKETAYLEQTWAGGSFFQVGLGSSGLFTLVTASETELEA